MLGNFIEDLWRGKKREMYMVDWRVYYTFFCDTGLKRHIQLKVISLKNIRNVLKKKKSQIKEACRKKVIMAPRLNLVEPHRLVRRSYQISKKKTSLTQRQKKQSKPYAY